MSQTEENKETAKGTHTEVVAKAKRRQYTAEYKLRILLSMHLRGSTLRVEASLVSIISTSPISPSTPLPFSAGLLRTQPPFPRSCQDCSGGSDARNA